MSARKDTTGLHAAIAQISECGRAAIESRKVDRSEQFDLTFGFDRFEYSTAELAERLSIPDQKRLRDAILGAFLIGSRATVSESAAALTRREQAGKGSKGNAEKPELIKRRKAVAEALNGRTVSADERWDMAGKIGPKVNLILKADKPVDQKQIYDDILWLKKHPTF
jgi:hypothetical protein